MPNQKRTRFKDLFQGSGLTFFVVFVMEMIEEGLENLIALGVSALFSTVLLVCITQITKLGIKKLIKLIVPFVKTLIYKEGNDKMKWIQKVGAWIRYNWKSLVGTCASAISGIVTTIAVNSEVLFTLPAICIFGLNFTPFIAGLLVFAGVELGVVCKGFETIAQAKQRIAVEKADKNAKAIVKEAKKEIKAEEKLANQTQAQKEKDDAKRIAKEKADAEKAQAEKQHRAELDKAKAELRAKIQPKS